MLVYIKCKVKISVQNITNPFEQTFSKLVNAPTPIDAKNKFEHWCKQKLAYMGGSSYDFIYIEVAEEI